MITTCWPIFGHLFDTIFKDTDGKAFCNVSSCADIFEINLLFGGTKKITISEKEIIYGFTNDLTRHLGLHLCVIVAKHYIYTTSRREEEYIWEAFFASLKHHLEIERHKSRLQIRFWAFLSDSRLQLNFVRLILVFFSTPLFFFPYY